MTNLSITREEFDRAIEKLSTVFPNFQPGKKNRDAWFAGLEKMDSLKFALAISVICEKEIRWWPDTNLVGLVNSYYSVRNEFVV